MGLKGLCSMTYFKDLHLLYDCIWISKAIQRDQYPLFLAILMVLWNTKEDIHLGIFNAFYACMICIEKAFICKEYIFFLGPPRVIHFLL